MGIGPVSACQCIEHAPDVGKTEAKLARSSGSRSDGVSPKPPGSRLVGGAGTTWLVSRGCAVRLRWTPAPAGGAGDAAPILYGAPQALLPEVIRVPYKVVEVAAGAGHALLLASSGNDQRVFAIGNNEYGQLGLGDALPHQPDHEAFEVVDLPASALVASISCGGHVSMATSQRGEVWTWGKNEESGVLGQGALPVSCAPAPCELSSLRRKVRVVQANTNGWTAFCLSHLGKVYSWGGGLLGVHGHGHQENEQWPKVIRALEGAQVLQVAVGTLHVVALREYGEVVTWGRVSGAFGSEALMQLTPKLVDALLGVRVVQVAAGADHSIALSADGEVYAWGAHTAGAIGNPIVQDPSIRYAFVHKADMPFRGKVLEVACGSCHSAFLTPAAMEPAVFLAPQVSLSAEKPSKADGKRPSGVDVWVCGTGVPVGEHIAAVADVQRHLSGLQRLLAPAMGTARPVQLMRLDVNRVLQMMC